MYTAAFHKAIESDELPQAQRLARYIADNLKPKRFYDFGCSTGLYLREVQHLLPGIPAEGLEFSPEAVGEALCPGVLLADLTKPQSLDQQRTGTLGLCLEVLEHIDDRYWRAVLENLTAPCDRLIFSAAIPGQGGTGHINCRYKIDWIRRFHDLGWVVDLDATKQLLRYMTSGCHMGWFSQNVMVLVPR